MDPEELKKKQRKDNRNIKIVFFVFLAILSFLMGTTITEIFSKDKEPGFDELKINVYLNESDIPTRLIIWDNNNKIQINGEHYDQVVCDCAKNKINPCISYCFMAKEPV